MIISEQTTANTAELATALALDTVLEKNATLIKMTTTKKRNYFITHFEYST